MEVSVLKPCSCMNLNYLVVAFKVGLLLQSVHEVLKDLLRDGGHAITPPLIVHDTKPDIILLINIILDLLIQLLC